MILPEKYPHYFSNCPQRRKNRGEGLDKGADDFITKPISTTKLISNQSRARRFDEKK
jgi:DNA-binding response OmpR family regulator